MVGGGCDHEAFGQRRPKSYRRHSPSHPRPKRPLESVQSPATYFLVKADTIFKMGSEEVTVDNSLPVSEACKKFANACQEFAAADGSIESQYYLIRYPQRYGIFNVRELLQVLCNSAEYQERYQQTYARLQDKMEVTICEGTSVATLPARASTLLEPSGVREWNSTLPGPQPRG